MLPHVLLALAHAQTFDGSGSAAPPLRADVSDPVFGLGGARWSPGGVSILGQAVSNPLVRELVDGDTTVIDPILGSLFGAEVSAHAPVADRIDLAISAPMWATADGETTGPAMGDIHAWVPVRLVASAPLELAAVPFLRLPTGPDARYLGDPFGAGLMVSAGTTAGPVFAHGDVGLDAGAASGADNWPGGVRGRFALDGGVQIQQFAVHAEVRGRAPLGASLPSVPSEGILALRGKPVERVSMTIGGGRAITRGVGASSLRMFVGTSIQLGRTQEDGPKPIGAQKEIREVNVIDAQRLPIRGATITAGNTEVVSDHEGFADLPLKAVKSGEMTVNAPGYLPVTMAISPETPWWEVQLQRAPVPLAVSAVKPDGTVADATITVVGPVDVGAGDFDEAGVEHWDLPQGEWRVVIEAEGFGRQERTIVIDDRRVDPIRVDAILTEEATPDTELAVTVVDALGRPVEDATVALGDRDIGTTGSGGDVVVSGLKKGEQTVVVRSNVHGAPVEAKVELVPGQSEQVQVVLDWQPGTVLVQVEGPDGKPTEAQVRLSGPDALPDRAVGSDGEEIFVLRPGTWEVEVLSPTLAPQARTIVVTDAPGELTALRVQLLPEEGGDSDLDLRVVDPDGAPVADLEITLDGSSVGTTGPDGTLSLRELQSGIRFVQIQGDLVVPRLTEVELVGQHQTADVVVWWVDGVVDFRAESVDGRPLDATITPHGGAEYPPFSLGLDGFERRVLAPGSWALEASASGVDSRSRYVEVPSGTHRRTVVTYRLEPPAPTVGRLTMVVRDPSGKNPASATVQLSDGPVETIANGFFQLDGVPVGELEVTVDGVGLAKTVEKVTVEERTELVVEPGWDVGAVAVHATGPDGPLDATLELRGPGSHPTVELTGGERMLELAPGTWTLSASHTGLGTATKEITVPSTPGLLDVTLALEPEKPRLLVDVTAPDQAPVANAEVKVDGEVIGRTDAAGRIVIEPEAKLPGGTRIRDAAVVQVVPDNPQLAPIEVVLPPARGEQDLDLVVPYAAREVEVAVVTPSGGAAGEVEVQAFGDETVTGQASNGVGKLELAPGTWTVTGRTADGQVGTARVVVPVDPAEPATVEVVLDKVEATSDGKVLRPVSPILFDTGKAVLRGDALAVLEDMARWLQADRTVALAEIAGHTDDQGGVAYNQELSEARARAVRDALIARGVAPERLQARGYGLSRPVTKLTDPDSRQRNRRVEVRVVSIATE